MPNTLKERVELLETQVHQLSKIVGAGKSARGPKDWRKTIGMSANDPEFDEMIRLGAEIRRKSGVTDLADT
jgi:hypothetical protein